MAEGSAGQDSDCLQHDQASAVVMVSAGEHAMVLDSASSALGEGLAALLEEAVEVEGLAMGPHGRTDFEAAEGGRWQQDADSNPRQQEGAPGWEVREEVAHPIEGLADQPRLVPGSVADVHPAAAEERAVGFECQLPGYP